MPLDQLLDAAIQIAEGLSAAHSHGIVHRDLKPQNVMVGQEGRIKILDFGLAKALHAAQSGEGEQGGDGTLSQDLTKTGVILGTLAYMSPEQIEGKAVDTRSDVFSFGTMLYEMATGENPHLANSHALTMYNVVEATPEPISTLRPGLPKRLEELTTRCLGKNPDHRYSDAQELLGDLKSVEVSPT
jgi:serine/threonine protein kinase